jgi:hypothetical protein
MKKIIGMGSAFLLSCVCAFSFTLAVKGHYFHPSDKTFREIYGGGPLYGGEIGIGLSRSLDFCIGGSYFSRTGELTYTKERTKLSILPVDLGLRYRFTRGTVIVYGSAGVEYCQFKESNPIGRVNKGGVGAVVKLGGLFRISRGFFIDLGIGYSYCRMKPADYRIQIGGVQAGGGLFFEF